MFQGLSRIYIVLVLALLVILSGCTPLDAPNGVSNQGDAPPINGETSIKASVDATLEAMAAGVTPTPVSKSGRGAAPTVVSTPTSASIDKTVDISELTTVTGRAMWNDIPLTDQEIQVIADVDVDEEWTPAATDSTTFHGDGYFTVSFSGTGMHTICLKGFPNSGYKSGCTFEVEFNPGETVDIGNVYVAKAMTLLTPMGPTGDVKIPTFRWEAFPEAVEYHLSIHEVSTGDLVFGDFIGASTEYVPEIPFTANVKYMSRVSAYTGSYVLIAESDFGTFNVGPDPNENIEVFDSNLMTVTGRAMWHDQPLVEVEIFTLPQGSRGDDPPTAVGSVDADGYFTISFAVSALQTVQASTSATSTAQETVDCEAADPDEYGNIVHWCDDGSNWWIDSVTGYRYEMDADGNGARVDNVMIWAKGTNQDIFWSSGRSVEFNPGETVDIGDLHVAKRMTLLTPERNGWTTTTPTFTWEAFPDAVNYHIDVFDTTTNEAVLREDTGSATEYTSETLMLTTNTKYEWSVHAESASGIEIAYFSAFYFIVGPDPELDLPLASDGEVINYDLDIIRGITPDGAYYDGEALETVVGIRGVPYEFIGWEIEGVDETVHANISWGDGEYQILYSQELMQNSGVIAASHIYSSGGVYRGYIDVQSYGNSVANSSFIVFINEASTETACDPTNPYDFIVSGFSFQGENDTFRKVDNLGNELGDTCGVEGLYQRPAVDNFYHKGIISEENGEYFWNNMGVSNWQLYPEFDLSRFTTDSNNPYFSESPYFTLFRGDADVTIGLNQKRSTSTDDKN